MMDLVQYLTEIMKLSEQCAAVFIKSVASLIEKTRKKHCCAFLPSALLTV